MWVGVVKHRTVGSSWREEEEEERVMERGRVEGLDYTAHKVTDCLVADSPLCPSFLSFFFFFFLSLLSGHMYVGVHRQSHRLRVSGKNTRACLPGTDYVF